MRSKPLDLTLLNSLNP